MGSMRVRTLATLAFGAVALLSASSGTGALATPHERIMRVRRIQVGIVHPTTGRFLPFRGDELLEVPSDAVVRVTFSRAVDLDSVTHRTIRMGYVGWDPLAGGHIDHFAFETRRRPARAGRAARERLRRRHVLVKPGTLLTDVVYLVLVPGLNDGIATTVRGRRGARVARSRGLAFRTADATADTR